MLTSMGASGRHGVVYRVLFIALSVMIALSFAIWGVGDVFLGEDRNVVVAEVGSVPIEGRSFLRLYTRQTESVQQALGSTLNAELGRQLGFVDSVMSDLIRRALFDSEADALGLAVSDDFVRERIFSSEEFQDERGVFSG